MKVANATQPYTILRGLVGSSVHGLSLEGKGDRDEMAVAIEPPEFLIGLGRAKFETDKTFQQGFEQQIERTQPEGVRSEPGDLDRTTYSLRKWMRLACAGNPTILTLLFVPADDLNVATEFGMQLQENSSRILSKECGPKFLGYLRGQKDSMLGLRSKKVTRQDLIDAHGYDCKYAMHVLRLAIQGIEVLRDGKMTLPMPLDTRLLVRSVREGKLSMGEVLDLINTYENELVDALAKSKLPDQPDWAFLNSWLVRTYRESWGW